MALVGMLVRNYASMVMRELGGRAGEWAGRACWRLGRTGVLAIGLRGHDGA